MDYADCRNLLEETVEILKSVDIKEKYSRFPLYSRLKKNGLISHWFGRDEPNNSNEPIENYPFYFYTILQAIAEAPTEIEKGELFSPQEEMSRRLNTLDLGSSSEERLCEHIVHYYNHRLPARYRMARYKQKAFSQLELKNAVVFQSIQTVFEKLFIDDNFLSKIFIRESDRTASYMWAAKNWFHEPLGLLHYPRFPIPLYTSFNIYPKFVNNRSEENPKKLFLIRLKGLLNSDLFDRILEQIKSDFNELLQEPDFFEGEEKREIDGDEALRLFLQSNLLEQL